MSIATELSRIQGDRNTIRDKLVELGLATSTDNLDALAEVISKIVNQGAVSVTLREGETYAIPAGYHDGGGTVVGVAGGGNYSLQSKAVTPTKTQQSVAPDSGYYGLSSVTVAPIPDAYQNVSGVTAAAGDVLTGKVIVLADGTVVTGTMPNNGAVSKTLSATVVEYTIPQGYHSGTGKVTITLETKTVTPTKSAQTVTPASGKLLSSVTVEAIPDKYQDVTPVTAGAGHVLEGYKIVDAEGNPVDGTMPDNSVGEDTFYFLTPSETNYEISEGYHDGYESVFVRSQDKTVTPTKETQTVQESGAYLGKVTVNPIPAPYHDVSGVTAHELTVLEGSFFVDNQGDLREGTIEVFSGGSAEIDGLTKTSVTFEPGYYQDGAIITLTDDIETALAAI